jgi:hypothetical protein
MSNWGSEQFQSKTVDGGSSCGEDVDDKEPLIAVNSSKIDQDPEFCYNSPKEFLETIT